MNEFENLEQKLAQLVMLHKQAREENRDLRVQVAKLETEHKALGQKVAGARARIETLVARMPAATEEA